MIFWCTSSRPICRHAKNKAGEEELTEARSGAKESSPEDEHDRVQNDSQITPC